MMVAVGSAVLEVTCGTGRAIVRPGQPVIIGRDVGCDLQVEGRLVSRRHAEVDVVEDGWVVRDLDSRNGTFVDGQKAAFVAVVDGGEIRLGSATDGPVVRFQVLPDESPAASPAPDGGRNFGEVAAQPVHDDAPEHREAAVAAAARSVAPALAARVPMAEHDAAGGRIRIGRGSDNDVVLADLRTSR